MAGANNETTNTAGTEGQPSTAPAGTPAPKIETKPEPKTEKTTTTSTTDAGGAGTEPKKPKIISGDDDEIPEGEDLLQMSPRALNARIARASRKQLKDAFGTDDLDTVKKLVEKAKKTAEKEETERKARLTETERLKEERDAAVRDAADARSQLTNAERARIVDRQDTRITRIAEKYLDADYIESEMPRLASDLRKAFKEKDAKLAKDETAWIEKWFQKRVETKPKLGKDFDTNGGVKPEPKTATFSNGVNTNGRPNAGSTGLANKTAAPGKPNSMSDKEIRESGYAWK